MNRNALIPILLLIPVLAMSVNIPSPFGMHSSSHPGNFSLERAWRINQVLQEGYSENAWYNDMKNVYYYNSAHPTVVDSIQNFVYNSANMQWSLSSSTVFTYDSNHEYVIKAEAWIVFEENSRFLFMREIVGYNANDYLTEITIQFNDFINGWSDAMRMHLQYANNNVSAAYTWNAGDDTTPVSYDKRTFTLDTQGRIITETNKVSSDSTNWVNDEHVSRTYHPHDTTTGAQFIYNLAHYYATAAMTESSPSFGMVSEEIDESWNGSAWVYDNKITFSYDASDRLITEEDKDWDGSSWVNSDIYNFTYETNGNLYQGLYQYWSGANWINAERKTYTWGETTANDDSSVPNVSGISVSAYPNPFSATQAIKVYSRSIQPVQVKVFNIKGQEVYSTSVQPNESFTWNTKEIPSGIYFLKAVQGEHSNVMKTVKIN